jgi:hypothetical protein
MRSRTVVVVGLLVLFSWGALLAQKEFREYPREDIVPLPPYGVSHE